MQIAPFSIRLADGLAEPQHRPSVKSNESAAGVAAQMRQGPCKIQVPANDRLVARHPPTVRSLDRILVFDRGENARAARAVRRWRRSAGRLVILGSK
jgi:hypothetical protein